MLPNNLFRSSVLALGLLGGSVLAYSAVSTTQEMAVPSKHHAVLEDSVGNWNMSCKMYMGGGSEPMLMKGTETNTMLGGFWLVSKFEGNIMGMQYEGHSQIGYDSKKKKFVGAVDSVSVAGTDTEPDARAAARASRIELGSGGRNAAT